MNICAHRMHLRCFGMVTIQSRRKINDLVLLFKIVNGAVKASQLLEESNSRIANRTIEKVPLFLPRL